MKRYACLLLLSTLAAASPVHAGSEQTDLHGFPLPSVAVARMGMARLRHGGNVHGMRFSPDGKTLASWGSAMRVWDLATGRQRHQLAGHSDDPAGLAFSADGKILTSTCRAGFVCSWDMTTGKLAATLSQDAAQGRDCVLSQDGKLVALIDHKGWLAIWDLADAKKPQRHRMADTGERILAISRDNRLVALGSNSAYSLRVWEAATGKEICHLHKPKEEHLDAVAFSPDGKTIASGGYGSISVWDLATSKEIRQLPTQKSLVWALAFSPDGNTLASGCSSFGAAVDGAVTLWQPTTGKKIRDLHGHVGGVQGLAFSADGKTLASGGWDHTVRLWDTATGAERFPCAGHVGAVRCAALSPDGKILASGGWDCSVRLWDPTTGRELHRLIGHRDPVLSVAFSRDGKTLISGSADDTTRYWDVLSGEAIKTDKDRGHACVFSADGRWLARARLTQPGATSITIHLEDTASQAKRFQLDAGHHRVDSLAFSPDGELLASSAGMQPEIRLWHVPSGRLLRPLQCGRRDIGGIRFSADGRVMMARCNNDEHVQLWETDTGREILRATGQPGELLYTFVSLPGDRVLAMGGQFGANRIHLHDIVLGKQIGVLDGHQGVLTALCASADGKMLVSASCDSTLLAWDVTKLGKPPPLPQAAAEEIPKLWADLLGEDATRAYRAKWALIGTPKKTAAFLAEALHAANPAAEERVPVFLRDLDSDDFETRDAGARELKRIAASAQVELLRALKSPSSLEFRRRVEQLLAALPAGPVPAQAGESLRRIRAIEVLEHIADPQAISVLKTLANRQPSGSEAGAARAALARLK